MLPMQVPGTQWFVNTHVLPTPHVESWKHVVAGALLHVPPLGLQVESCEQKLVLFEQCIEHWLLV
jgi:hypothetical protein